MPSYRVRCEIDIEAETPLEAAYSADFYMQQGNRNYSPCFSIINSETGESCLVDLDQENNPE